MSLANKLTQERRGRLAAERLLELKQAELFAANRKLGEHAQQLTEEIVETRAVVATIRGENQRVKSDLSAANQKIAIAERRLWHSIQSIKDGFAFFDADNEMTLANPAYLAIFDGLEVIRPGVNYVTILQALTDEGVINPGVMSCADWRRMMVERLHQPEPEPVVIELWNGHFIKLIDQRVPGGDMVSLGLDITATVEYEAQLKEARIIAESANRAKSAFLANMSHEIRTPMNGVVGMAELLKDTALSEEQQLYVDTIKNSGEALLVIINDVLDYSKIDAKKLELRPEAFDLERALQEIVMLLQPSATDKGLLLLLDYDMTLPARLIGDPGRIRQVLTNLIGNAVKFTTEGHVLITVTGTPNPTASTVGISITIADTGIGIPEDMVDHIFGEFNQVENERNRQFDGTGLGLAISQQLIGIMGGKIWVTSTGGAGSTFGFTLDLAAVDALERALPNLPTYLHHVLIVDDITVERELMQRQLLQLGLKVTACTCAADALDRIDATCDLLITDHKMPGSDGFELAKSLRRAGHALPILLLSETPDHARKNPARPQVQRVLQKPLSRQVLLAELQACTPHPETAVSAPPADTPPPLRPMRILAAEDNKTNQLVFRKMIKNLNVELSVANNGEMAVALFKSNQPDLVFMDISMPKMDGKQATRAIRALEADSGGHVPIVALTAHAMDGDDAGILAAGLDHYLTKPLRKPLIIAQITDAWTDAMEPLDVEVPDQAAE